MQRTTLPSYPNLIPVQPINGVVYKATEVSRPHPKMAVMPDEEVRKHQKSESVGAVMQKHARKPSLFNFTKKSEDEAKHRRYRSTTSNNAPVSNPRASEDTVEVVVPEGIFEILNPTGATQAGKKKDKYSVLKKLKKAIKKVFHFELVNPPPKPPIKIKATTRESTIPQGAATLGHRRQRSGFHCSMGGCESCVPPEPATPPHLAAAPPSGPQVQTASLANLDPVANIIEQLISSSNSSFGSGVTSSNSPGTTPSDSNNSQDPSTRRKLPKIYVPSTPSDYGTPNTIDHNIFDGFSGVHCSAEATPPQIALLRPVSSFIDKPHGTILSSHIDGFDFEDDGRTSTFVPSFSSSPKSKEEPVATSESTTPELLTSPDLSSTLPELSSNSHLSLTPRESSLPFQERDWPERHIDTPTPCPKPWRLSTLTNNERLWSFDLVAPDSCFSVLLTRGDEARSRRKGRRVSMSSISHEDCECEGEIGVAV
jgi:hypothetical protein